MTRAMVIVAAGTGSRFENDKMLTPVDGRPLVEITVSRVKPHVDQCILVCRADQVDRVKGLGLDVTLAVGGPTRTTSEIAGLRALGSTPELIGIHDGARPNITGHLIESLYETATALGGAVPVIEPAQMLIDRSTTLPIDDLVAVQTPQVFRGRQLVDAYRAAEAEGVIGHDTLEIIQKFSDLEVAAVEGSPTNLKVTFPIDLARVIPL